MCKGLCWQTSIADRIHQVEAYFARFHFLMPVIDKPSFLRRYKDVMDNKDDHVVARSEAGFLSLIFAVFSCAAQLVQDPRLTVGDRQDDGGMGMFYYERYARWVFQTSFAFNVHPQRISLAVYQPRKYPDRACPMFHFAILLPLFSQLPPTSVDIDWPGGPSWSRSRTSCKPFTICSVVW